MHLNFSHNAASISTAEALTAAVFRDLLIWMNSSLFCPSSCFFSFLPKTEEKIQWCGGAGVVCSVIVPYSAHWKTNHSLLLINLCVCNCGGSSPFSNTQGVALKVCVSVFSLPAHHILIFLWCVYVMFDSCVNLAFRRASNTQVSITACPSFLFVTFVIWLQ